MRPILIGCEESQTICAAFRAAGYEAYSCDLLPTRGNPDWHYQEDIKKCLKRRKWSLVILHPDCTAMALAGNRHYGQYSAKHKLRLKAVSWTLDLWALAKKQSHSVALENPASVIFPELRKKGAHIQYVQPYEFGHPERKKTGFALHNLAPLIATKNVYKKMMSLPKKDRDRIHYMSPGPNRKRDRSKTYSGIADAIVSQWLPTS